MTDFTERFHYWTILAFCGFVGTYAPNVWHALASIGGAFLIGAVFATVATTVRVSDEG